jgi:hypothetical protein
MLESRLSFVCTAINCRVGVEEISFGVSKEINLQIISTYSVFRLNTASLPGIASTKNQPPLSNP